MSNIYRLMQILARYQLEIVHLAPFFIPASKLSVEEAIDPSSFRFYSQEDISQFQKATRIQQAFCYSEEDPDQLGLAYLEEGEIQAICGANWNGAFVWEIGVEILHSHIQRKGLATQ